MLESNELITEMEISQVSIQEEKSSLEDKNLKKRTSSSPEKCSPERVKSNNVTWRPDESPQNDNEAEDANSSKRIRSSPIVADEAGSESPAIPEKLEVPSTELQYIQKQVLVEKLMGLTSPSSKKDDSMDVQIEEDVKGKPKSNKSRAKKPPFRVPQLPPKQDFRKTFKMRSSLLDRVKSFLPEMKNANEELLRLPDPSKLSLESDSDRDEMDGAVPGPSGSCKKPISTSSKAGSTVETKTYVEMNLALIAQSDSDTSSEDDESYSVIKGPLKGLPVLHKRDDAASSSSSKKEGTPSESPDDKAAAGDVADSEANSNKKLLITELN